MNAALDRSSRGSTALHMARRIRILATIGRLSS